MSPSVGSDDVEASFPRQLCRRRLLREPGTSERHLIAAVDEVPEMRMILVLFEES
jgi:hypothetical protein